MQERLNSDFVLEKYAEVCRYYGKTPSSPEIRLYARQTPNFISHNTFTKHFGTKEALIAALRDRAIEQNEADLVAILPKGKVAPNSAEASRSSKVPEGWVYLLQSGSNFKIGRSDELERRVKQISIALPDKVQLIHAIKTDDPAGIEFYWHRRFAAQRANGEWFKLSIAEVKAFKRRKFQ
jgi:AcrR family transcriptional regulator